MEDISLRSSMKTHSKGNLVLLLVNSGTLTSKEYSSIMIIPVNKRILERVQPVNTSLWCLCQALVSESENDLLNIPVTYWIFLCSNFQPVLSTVERHHIYVKQKQSTCGGWTHTNFQFPTIYWLKYTFGFLIPSRLAKPWKDAPNNQELSPYSLFV